MTVRKLFAAFTTFALLMSATVMTVSADSSGGAGTQTQQTLIKGGTTRITAVRSAPTNSAFVGGEFHDRGVSEADGFIHGHPGPAPVPSTQAPNPATQNVVSATGTTHYGGLNHYDQRTAGTGVYANTQFSLEPPDQGLCVGKGFVVETVNDVIRVRSAANGAPLTGAMPLSEFFGLDPEFDRVNLVFGDFISDPKCYFDSAGGGHWFVTLLEIDQDADGVIEPDSHMLIAVSAGSDPTGAFNLFRFDTADDGTHGTPVHLNCPCYGDQPLIGADANGFYITTNEFPIFVAGFNGAMVYAMSKSALTSGSGGIVVAFYQPTLAEGQAYSIQPATAPQGGNYAGENGGTEYFLSALEFTGGLDNRIALWSLTNTSSLKSASPKPKMAVKVLKSEVYGLPPVIGQRAGNAPFGQTLGDPLAPINSNDDRMNQTVYVDGEIWGALNTVVKSNNGGKRVGIAWFAVKPSTGQKLDGSVTAQGYVAVDKNSVVFPSVAANVHGDVLVAFTLAGPDYYPSAAYARLDKSSGSGSVRVVSRGVGPADGFTGYPTYYPPSDGVERWGDYSAAVADASGNLWFATETINQSCTVKKWTADPTCGGTRTQIANWGTIIAKVHP